MNYLKNQQFLDNYGKGYDVYDHYLGKRLRIGQHINSPFRSDSDSHSFNLYINKANGLVYFKDHVSETFGDAVDFVKQLFSLTHKQAKEMIEQDLFYGLHKGEFTHLDAPVHRTFEATNVLMSYQKRHWSKADQFFWQQWCVPFDPAFAIHEKLQVFPAEWVHVQRDSYQYRFYYQESDPLYLILFPSGRMKAYRPLAGKKYKWRSTTTADDIFGLHLLEDNLPAVFLMAGNKDVLCMTTLLNQYLCIAMPSETTHLSPYVYELLKSKAQKLFIIHDADKEGRRTTERIIASYPLFTDASAPVCTLHSKNPAVKDFADMIHLYRHTPTAIEAIRAYFFDLIY